MQVAKERAVTFDKPYVVMFFKAWLGRTLFEVGRDDGNQRNGWEPFRRVCPNGDVTDL